MVADELGCELDVASSGSDALERLGTRAPDILLVDVKTPDVSGWEICRKVKTSPAGADTQVLLVTNREDEDETLPGFDALAADYVARPFIARELRARLRSALRARELLDALALRTRFSDLER